jgi:hypothetical protein
MLDPQDSTVLIGSDVGPGVRMAQLVVLNKDRKMLKPSTSIILRFTFRSQKIPA